MGDKNNEGSRNDSNQNLSGQFDYLITRYLAGKASSQEKKELRQLVENGFEEHFLQKIDEHYYSNEEVENLPDQARQEILSNILGTSPGQTRTLKWRIGWAAAVLLALASVFWLMTRQVSPNEGSLTEIDLKNKESEFSVSRGKQFLILPDGSSVLLNEGAELSYSYTSFDSKLREVNLAGEAYFDIAHNPEKAFIVHTGSVVTRVLGTAFNVNASSKEVVVTVDRGLVGVGRGDRIYAQLKPDEQIRVDSETEQYNTVSVNSEDGIAWTKAYLVFNNINLEEASRLIGEQYGVELTFPDTNTAKCRITASFLNGEELGTVLKVISEMIGATFIIEGDQVRITGGGC